MDETFLLIVTFYGGIALILATLWGISRWSYRRHIRQYGPPPPGSALRTSGWFVVWSALLSFLVWAWPDGALVVMAATILVPQLGFNDRAWGPWQRFRDAGIYAAVLFVPIAFIAYSAQSS